jgi:uncharacterized protein YjbI with pentapeptide repeats
MANDEHLRIINQGMKAWNEWRRDTFRGFPDLGGTDLTKARLSGVDFSDVDLSGADLKEAELWGADCMRVNLSRAYLNEAVLHRAQLRDGFLSWADVRDADLSEADLSDTNLIGADFSQANLTDANFTNADLRGAKLIGAECTGTDFRHADLRGANLSGARLYGTDLSHADLIDADLTLAYVSETTFGNNDLSAVKGLLTVNHFGPSTIGIDTLFRSDGKIPEGFLRGAGVPEDFITFVPSLVGRAIEFYSCFISYSHQDEEFSQHLHSRMRGKNLRVWYAPEDMKGGRKLHEEIFRAIQIHDKLLLVLSEHSMKSEWVATEIRRARKVEREESRRKLFPIRLVDFEAIENWECFDADSGKDLAIELREYYIPDFSNWKDHDAFEAEFAKLLRDLKAET